MSETIKNESGQSTIEFIISFTLAIGFLISFYKIAMLYTNGYLIHYATFQASRAYMIGETGSNTSGGSDGFAGSQAKKVFDFYKLPDIVPGFESSIIINDPESNTALNKNLYVGLQVKYEDSLLIPGTAKRVEIPLMSESFLGMEPTRAECFSGICSALGLIGASCTVHTTVTDNGC
jgi:hypothetical protein